ncbi:MAG TPA: chemotaxis protein CheW [Geopsychrobacteraceae bacterium]|jgi:purine-binding chemotaxis protein CheW
MIQVLPFVLGGGLYGLELTQIQEVVDAAPVYYLPGAPEGIMGALNFHGRILPVLDLPLQFGFAKGPRSARMIVPTDRNCPLVLAVDSVRSVLSADAQQIKPCLNVAAEETVQQVLDLDGQRIRLVDLTLLRKRVGRLCELSGG